MSIPEPSNNYPRKYPVIYQEPLLPLPALLFNCTANQIPPSLPLLPDRQKLHTTRRPVVTVLPALVILPLSFSFGRTLSLHLGPSWVRPGSVLASCPVCAREQGSGGSDMVLDADSITVLPSPSWILDVKVQPKEDLAPLLTCID
jgi:hypothetical protein